MATASVRPSSADVVGRQFVRDPDSWLLYVAAAVLSLSAVQLFVYPFGRTLCEYAIDGREILLGGAPGKHFWSLRAPGIALLHAAIQRFIAPTAIAARAFEVLCLFGILFLAIRLSKRFSGFERVGLIGGALALFVHSQLEYEHTGQPELYATLFVGFAALLTVSSRTRHWRHLAFVSIGALVSVSLVFVPLYVLTLAPLCRWIWCEERELRLGRWAPLAALLTVIGGSCIAPSLLAIWLWKRAALGIFIQDWFIPQTNLWAAWSLDGFLQWLYFTADRLVLRQSALVPAGVLLAFVLPGLNQEERRGLRLLLGLVVCQLMAFAISYESNPGRLSGALPILSIIAGIGIYKTYRRMLQNGLPAVFAFSSGMLLLGALCTAVDVPPGSYFYRSWIRLKYIAGLMPYRAPELLEAELYSNNQINLAVSRRVAATLDGMHPFDRQVLVQGDEPQVLWFARLRPATRLVRPMPEDLAVVDPELETRLSREVERSGPRIIVVSPAASAIKAPTAARRLGFDRGLLERFDLAAAREGWVLRVPKP
ncbi:MAG TPA: hypothetical protein VKP30_17035 [Polyangiaceae bacterium]|nr:hypothetical protein [Polyangiaceae bacterium]